MFVSIDSVASERNYHKEYNNKYPNVFAYQNFGIEDNPFQRNNKPKSEDLEYNPNFPTSLS